MEMSENITPIYGNLSFDELNALKKSLTGSYDVYGLIAIRDEARLRDGNNDTDASYNYLATECDEEIKRLMPYFG